jgi:NADH pyrophosphatase NudC (nudix superfamily)
MHIIVGGIVEKEGKILMVQEKKKFCYGKWNIPAGHLDPNETIIEGAIREIREETGCEVKATGVAIVANKVMPDDVLVEIIFSTKLVNEDIKINPDEILDVKWIDKEDILNNMDEELRDITFIKKPIMNIIDGKVASLDVIGTI